MKRLVYALICVVAAVSCTTHSGESGSEPIDAAEQAYADGHYRRAQNVAEELLTGSGLEGLDVGELCRVSLLFERLGDATGNEDGNTAVAARALSAAFAIDSDSTARYIGGLSLDDRARMSIVATLANRGNGLDSLIVEPDSIY